MLEDENFRLLKACRMPSGLEFYQEKCNSPEFLTMSSAEVLNQVLTHEIQGRVQKKYARDLKNANLFYSNARIEELDYRAERNLKPSVIKALTGLSWLWRLQNIVVLGATGSGKSYLADCFGELCIRDGHVVYRYRLADLLEEAELARADGSLPKLKKKIVKCKALILDDLGIAPIIGNGRNDLLTFVESKVTTGSLIITSQLPVEAWYEWIGDPTIADAILDRIVHRSHVIKLKGDSMRKLIESIDGGAK